jgi:hypothetical protein
MMLLVSSFKLCIFIPACYVKMVYSIMCTSIV